MFFTRQKIYRICFINLMLCSCFASARNGIVQADLGERLGDKLLIICAVKFLALVHDLDFYYRPCWSLVEQFSLSRTEAKFNDHVKAHYNNITTFNPSSSQKTESSTLFMAPWSSIDNLCKQLGKRHIYRQYFDELQKMVTPIAQVTPFEIPHDSISVAVHVRKGEGYDNPLSSAQIYKDIDTIYWGTSNNAQAHGAPADRSWPYKFPPEQYYIDQINFLADLFPSRNITCYVFSDSLKPKELTQRFAHYCKKPNTKFINASSSKDDSPMIDICKIAACDCLIRAESSYSIIAQILGNHKIIFSPQKCEWRNNILYVPQVRLMLFDSINNKGLDCSLERCDKESLQAWINELFG